MKENSAVRVAIGLFGTSRKPMLRRKFRAEECNRARRSRLLSKANHSHTLQSHGKKIPQCASPFPKLAVRVAIPKEITQCAFRDRGLSEIMLSDKALVTTPAFLREWLGVMCLR